MAYQGRKVFQAGEVLASSDMNSTVDQTVMVFADATARNTAIPTPTEGMLVYLKDTDKVLKYDGTNWIEIIETADDLITTEGDLIIGGVGGDAERLPIGSLSTVLTSDGTTMSWAAVDTGPVSTNFVIDMNNSSNNTAEIGETKPSGTYSINFSSGDTTFDVYLIDDNGDSVGYTNSTSITASADFTRVVIFGVPQDEIISFIFQGIVAQADGEGDEPGAGAYLESISPSDLPSIDDTATVTGGNFGADTEIYFDSGQTSLEAKNITVNNSTELIVTRPDNLDANLDPWTLRTVTTGVPEPTGSSANLLIDGVTAGAVPVWVTTSPLESGTIGVAYTDTLEATDADGDVTYSITAGSLPTGLSLDSSTGVISGTPTAGGQTFTATATDDGGSQTSREFSIQIPLATGGTVTSDGNFIYHTFTSTDDFEALVEIPNAEYLVIAGGGSGDRGGAGAGGLLNATATVPLGIHTVTIGAGGVPVRGDGNDTSFGSIESTTGGGGGGGLERDSEPFNGRFGGSGGGAGRRLSGTGSGGGRVAGQGNVGGNSNDQGSAGGGGAGAAGGSQASGGAGGSGLEFADFASATSTGDNGFYAGGGSRQNGAGAGPGGGGNDGDDGLPNTGGGAGAGNKTGGSGLVIVRYAI